MNTNLRSLAMVVAGMCGLFVIFTVVSSLFILYSTQQLRFFVFPYDQWWYLLYQNWGEWPRGAGLAQYMPWIKLITAGIIGLMIPVIILKLTLQRAGFFMQGAGSRTRMGGQP